MRSKILSVLLLCSFAIGCTPSASGPVATKGTVKTKRGRPCDNALVVFHPLEKDWLNDPKQGGTDLVFEVD